MILTEYGLHFSKDGDGWRCVERPALVMLLGGYGVDGQGFNSLAEAVRQVFQRVQAQDIPEADRRAWIAVIEEQYRAMRVAAQDGLSKLDLYPVRLQSKKRAPATNRIEACGPSGAVLLWVAKRPGLHEGFCLPHRTTAIGCGFNQSTQHIGQSVLPVSRSRASAGGVRSADER
jgi:hypothetical protein